MINRLLLRRPSRHDALVAGFALALAPSAIRAQTLQPIRVGSSPNEDAAPIVYGQTSGLFRNLPGRVDRDDPLFGTQPIIRYRLGESKRCFTFGESPRRIDQKMAHSDNCNVTRADMLLGAVVDRPHALFIG